MISLATKEIVTLDEHVQDSILQKDTNSCIKFDYALNDKSSRAKILKAAERPPIEIEENSTSSNLVLVLELGSMSSSHLFNIGMGVQGEQSCKIGDYQIKIGGVKAGKEKNGKIVNTQIVFYAGRDKIVCHLYNTTQLVLVNGHGYQKFINTFLKPFFASKVEQAWAELGQAKLKLELGFT